jgi:hypothetical protein
MRLIFLFLFLPIFTFAQTTVKGTVKDVRGNPLPFTNIVSIRYNKGTITNDKGKFEFNNIEVDDSVKITNIAYQPRIIAISDIISNGEIILKDSVKLLREVIVRNFNQFKNNIVLGYFKFSKNGEFKLEPGSQLAIFIDNPLKREGWIKNVKFSIKHFGKCKNGFRLRILQADSISLIPSLDILDESIVMKSSGLSKNNTVDLSSYKLIMPKEGVYVLLEWLNTDSDCNDNSYTSIAANLETPHNLVWLNFRDRKWGYSNRPRLPNGNFMTPNIGIEVAF